MASMTGPLAALAAPPAKASPRNWEPSSSSWKLKRRRAAAFDRGGLLEQLVDALLPLLGFLRLGLPLIAGRGDAGGWGGQEGVGGYDLALVGDTELLRDLGVDEIDKRLLLRP
jgi:hypothetical protein